MSIEKQKLNSALDVVSNSLLHGWTIEAKIEYIKHILPEHFEVKESKQKGNIHCKSSIGIKDDEQWSYFMSALKHRFQSDFLEVYHNICHNHVDFTVYFKQKNKNN
jgi:hypothetical protein